MSKILIKPKFKDIPKSTLANVEENIINWLSRNKWNMIETFCRKDSKYKTGYRFIISEDLDETIVTNQTISKIPFKITWYRRLHTTDHFCPLYFSEWYITINLKYKDYQFEFSSDNNLKKHIKHIKNGI